MKKIFMLVMSVLFLSSTSLFAQSFLCPGTTADLSYTSSPADPLHYTSSDTTVISIDSVTGIAHAHVPGTVLINYHSVSGIVHYSLSYSVLISAPPVSGDTSLCIGSTTTLASIATRGYWQQYGGAGSVSDPWTVGVVDSFSGLFTAYAAGRVEIYYAGSSTYCESHFVINVHATSVTSDSLMAGYSHQVCVGSGISLTPSFTSTDTTGIWTSSNPSIASVFNVAPTYPLATIVGVSAGVATISYSLTTGCNTSIRYRPVTVVGPVAVSPVSGPHTLCLGASITLVDTLVGGVWTASDTSVAVVHSGTVGGPSNFTMVNALSVGSVTITYAYTGFCALTPISSVATFPMTIVPLDVAGTISGPSSVCSSASVVLSASGSGGTWSSSAPAIAGVDASGNVTGLSAGTATISYSVVGTCNPTLVTATVTVPPTVSAGAISGASTVCPGATTPFTSTIAGGVWSTASAAVATVDAAGTVGGISAGNTTISYTVTGACNTSAVSAPLTVLLLASAGVISGPATVVAGNTINLTNTVSGGTWSVSPASVAAIDAATGVLSGLSSGAAVVTYTATGCGGPVSATHAVTVVPADAVSGNIHFTAGGAYTGNVKVWLITFVSPMLTAVDSVIVSCSDTMIAYQFTGVPTGTYRIKAALTAAPVTTTDYIPTYATSSFYWNTANVLNHTAGSVDANQDILMAYGAATTGPGFIAGDVTTGANKGTTSGVPVNGLMMYLFNATTSQLMQSVRTDATGHYSFGNLPVWTTYYVFPDSLNYLTTPYTNITLTTPSPLQMAANFVQHTISHTITPVPAGVAVVNAATGSLLTSPNPTTGRVNISWQLPAAQQSTVTVADITGRIVYKNDLHMSSGSGNSSIDLSSLNDGLYTISILSPAISYNNKIQVQH